MKECVSCEGVGRIFCEQCCGIGVRGSGVECEDCEGTGMEDCWDCGATGEVADDYKF